NIYKNELENNYGQSVEFTNEYVIKSTNMIVDFILNEIKSKTIETIIYIVGREVFRRKFIEYTGKDLVCYVHSKCIRYLNKSNVTILSILGKSANDDDVAILSLARSFQQSNDICNISIYSNDQFRDFELRANDFLPVFILEMNTKNLT